MPSQASRALLSNGDDGFHIQSQALLLDTNLLLLLFMGAKDKSLIPKARTLSAFLEDDNNWLEDIIDNNFFNCLITPPHNYD
ncbi:hypothetical protein Syn6312_0392 [Synechococcus sp. PCC 6312]|nr:hypothetical protein Syn6312_0392 [Synechococcus sp. PCC 6312]